MPDIRPDGAGIRYRRDVRMPCMPSTPPAVRRRARPRIGRLLAAVMAAAVLVVGLGSGSAWAHDALAGSGPAEGETVQTAPANVTLEFNAPPQALGTQVVVTGPDGASVSDGDPAIRDGTVTQPLAEGLPAGDYTVDWRVTSADGHPISGTFVFTVAQGAPATAEQSATGTTGPADDTAGTATASPATASQAAASSSDDSSFPVVWIAIGAILALGVGLVIRQLRRTA